MSQIVVEDGILRGLPGWDGARCTALAGGLTNRTWRVEHGRRRGVLKLDAAPRQAPFGDRSSEAAIQRRAARAGIAPRVLFDDTMALLTEYVDGPVWDTATLTEPGNLERLATVLRRLHALPLSGRRFNAAAAAQRYVATIAPAIDSADRELLGLCMEIADGQSLPISLCCCHNDLVAANVIAGTESKPMLLDWEYACDNDPAFDLAVVIEHHGLRDDLAAHLLGTYCDGQDMIPPQRLAAQRRLYLALLWLWMAARPQHDRDELVAVGERLVTSCS